MTDFKTIKIGSEARAKLFEGADLLARAVRVTLGPAGRNVVIQRANLPPRITKDGVTVAQEVTLRDPIANVGAQLVREVAVRTKDETGDGTTTATVLAHAILEEGLKSIERGTSPVELKRGIDRASLAVEKLLQSVSTPIDSIDDVRSVATIASNGEEEIGELVSSAVGSVGLGGIITVEETKLPFTSIEFVKGVQFDRGYLSPHFVNKSEDMTVDLQRPHILLFERSISDLSQVQWLLEQVLANKMQLLIVAENVEGAALATLLVNKLRGGLKIAAVRAPGFGLRRKAWLGDLAAITGGQVLSEDLGQRLENLDIGTLGRAERVLITKDTTTIIEGHGSKDAVASRTAEIIAEINATTSESDTEDLKRRRANLSAGVAVVKVGGATELEVKERRDRIEDALCATKAAIELGIVAGGGAALAYAARQLDEGQFDSPLHEGVRVVTNALLAPLRQILSNAGFEPDVMLTKLAEEPNSKVGFNARTGSLEDLIATGVVDPVKVVIMTLRNAASVASLMLTTEAIVCADSQVDHDGSPGGGGSTHHHHH